MESTGTLTKWSGLSETGLKWIALVTMVLDHIHYFFGFTGAIPEWFSMVGRLGAPLFLFCLVEGFTHTHDRKKYFAKVYILSATMSTILFFMAYVGFLVRPDGFYPTNGIMTTFVILMIVWQGIDWERQEFYPLQLRFSLEHRETRKTFTSEAIRLANPADISDWMGLVQLVVDGYPVLDETDYLQKLQNCIDEQRALILKDGNIAIGVLAFSYDTGRIEFIGVHPQYRNCGLQKLFLDQLMETYLPGREISTTTYREHDKADTGYRKELKLLGFAERELLTEFGYPTQRFVLSPPEQEEMGCK